MLQFCDFIILTLQVAKWEETQIKEQIGAAIQIHSTMFFEPEEEEVCREK